MLHLRQKWKVNVQQFISAYKNTDILTRLTELKALPPCQLLV